VADLLEKNQSLEIEVSVLRQKLAETADLKKWPSDSVLRLFSSSTTSLKVDSNSRELIPDDEQTTGVMKHGDGGFDATGEKAKLEEELPPECCLIVETAVDGGSEEGTVNLEDDQLGLMTCSLSSTTSGFDDNSCASSVTGGDEMPSEETWHFNVHDEACRQPAVTESPNSDSESSQQNGGVPETTITEEQVKQMEKIWLSRMEKLERRLMQAVEGEQRARDQMALLVEERDRRIAVLERQVDVLEADEFRLTKTIQTLEQLERVFRTHFLTAIDTMDPHHLHSARTLDMSTGIVEEEDKSCSNLMKIDRIKEIGFDGAIGHPCCNETCLQCHACQTLKSTIELLHSALAEQSAVDRRVRELQEDMNGSQSDAADDHSVLEVVDFEAEYRELEALFRELKQVLVVDRSADGCPVIRDSSPTSGERKDNERGDRKVLSLPIRWNLSDDLDDDDDDDDDDDETVSMVTSPDLEIDASAVKALNQRNRELEISEQYLRQQVTGQFIYSFSLL